jgi:hypothetical protein
MWILHLLVPHSGSKIKTELLGHMDDFCPICRDVTEFSVMNYFTQKTIRVAGVVNLEDGREGGQQVCDCSGCGGRWRLADGFLSSGPESSEEARGRYQARVELEKRATTPNTTSEERSTLMMEPFRFMAATKGLHELYGKGDAASTWGCFGTATFAFAWFLLLGPLLGGKHQQSGGNWLLLVLPLLLIGAIGTLVAFFTQRRRYIRREIESRIARSLKPLGPSKQELASTLDRFRDLDPDLAGSLDAARIHDRMRGVVG